MARTFPSLSSPVAAVRVSDPHRHPYEETFVVQDGTSEFTVDGNTFEVTAGSIVVAPAGAVHSFKGSSDGVTRQINIHPVAEMVTEWIE
jgi:quercetin dioxygenase-like cupin family protein